MMSKLGVLLTICLLLFPLTALTKEGDQPVGRPAERQHGKISSEQHTMFDPIEGCCQQSCTTCFPC
uniref:Conotoxin Lt3.8 n=1 Tax=Conus litteratus TaxID=89445 RepID=F5BDG6_CONLT|nr:conotoxin Lt3.8 [Conus litteratus]